MCCRWDLNPRQLRLEPKSSALDHSATTTTLQHLGHVTKYNPCKFCTFATKTFWFTIIYSFILYICHSPGLWSITAHSWNNEYWFNTCQHGTRYSIIFSVSYFIGIPSGDKNTISGVAKYVRDILMWLYSPRKWSCQ